MVPAAPDDGDDAKRERKEAEELLSNFDKYVATITTDPEGTGAAPLIEAALAEMAVGAADEGDALLYVDIAAQGADAVTAFGLLKGSRAAFLGFVQAYFVVARPDGTILGSGSMTEHVSAPIDLETAELTVAG
jgi:hypothetical protein